MYKVDFEVEAMSPLIISTGEGEQNTVKTLGYIPGRQLLGAFAGRFIQLEKLNQNKNNNAHLNEQFKRWFLDGGIKFGNAYPSIERGGRRFYTYPTPLCLYQDKNGKKPYNFIETRTNEDTRPVGGFTAVDGYILLKAETATRIFFHQRRDGDRERLQGHSLEGGLFTYEALAVGQLFTGELWGEKEELQRFRKFFGEGLELRVGRSCNVQYGRVRMSLKEVTSREFEALSPSENHINLVLRSPLLLTSSLGFAETSLSGLERLLEKKIAGDGTISDGRFKVGKSFVKMETSENYVAVWKMKRPPVSCLAAGSCLQLYFPAGIDNNILALFRRLEATGIGERLQEGFGRISFLKIPSDLKYPEREQRAPVKKKPPEKMPETAGQIFTSIIRERLASYLVLSAIKNSQTFKIGRLPSTSLLGKLELILRYSGDAETFISSLKSLPEPTRKRLEGCQNKRQTLFQVLETPSPGPHAEMWNENPEAERLNIEANLGLQNNREFLLDMYRLYTLEFIRGLRRMSKAEGREKPNA